MRKITFTIDLSKRDCAAIAEACHAGQQTTRPVSDNEIAAFLKGAIRHRLETRKRNAGEAVDWLLAEWRKNGVAV